MKTTEEWAEAGMMRDKKVQKMIVRDIPFSSQSLAASVEWTE